MKLISSLLIASSYALYYGDGDCKRPLWGKKETCMDANRDDGCCSDTELCQLYGNQVDVQDHFPNLVCQILPDPSTTVAATTADPIAITSTAGTTRIASTTQTVTVKPTTTLSQDVCDVCDTISSPYKDTVMSMCKDQSLDCPFSVRKCDPSDRAGPNRGYIELPCFAGQFVHVDSAFFGRFEDAPCCTAEQKRQGLCEPCEPINTLDFFRQNCDPSIENCILDAAAIEDTVLNNDLGACAGRNNYLTVQYHCEDEPFDICEELQAVGCKPGTVFQEDCGNGKCCCQETTTPEPTTTTTDKPQCTISCTQGGVIVDDCGNGQCCCQGGTPTTTPVRTTTIPKTTSSVEIQCPNTPNSCPVGTTCVESHQDTIIEYQRSGEEYSQSGNSLIISLYDKSTKVSDITLDKILNSPDLTLRKHNLGKLPKWNKITLAISGSDGASFDVFRIIENVTVVFDLVERKGCESVWLDGNVDDGPGKCYTETMFREETFDRDVKLASAGNFQFEYCKAPPTTTPMTTKTPFYDFCEELQAVGCPDGRIFQSDCGDGECCCQGTTTPWKPTPTAPCKDDDKTTVRPPVTPENIMSFEKMIQKLMPYVNRGKNVNANYAPQNFNVQNFVDIATDINTNINVNFGMGEFNMPFDREMAAKMLAEKLNCSPEKVTHGIHVLEGYLKKTIKDYIKH